MKKINLPVFVFIAFILSQCGKITHDNTIVSDISDLEINSETSAIYKERQKKLLDQVENGIIILNSNAPAYTGGRQAPRGSVNFYYLTGITQNDLTLVLLKENPNNSVIVIHDRDMMTQSFYGETISKTVLIEKYGIGEVIGDSTFKYLIEKQLLQAKNIYIDFADEELANHLIRTASNQQNDKSIIKDFQPIIAEMRVKKDHPETERLQKAIDITGKAFTSVLLTCKPEMYEFEMEALIEYNFLKYGAAFPGFTSIVATGDNSTTLHYASSTSKMNDGDVLLMDIGAEYGYYTADISRTIPVNGKFSPEQKEIYELVLNAQKAAIELMKPGNFINSGHLKANEILIEGLAKLGLITDIEKEWQRKFYIFYPASHYLGMNVHDVGDYGAGMMEFMVNRANTSILGRPLEPGMVLTIEPGLYFRKNGLEQISDFFGEEATKEEIDTFISKVAPVYEKYKNIGIRIEDDVLITETGNRVLSQNIPKELHDIEKMMKLSN